MSADNQWAVFVFRRRIFFERRSVLQRLPFIQKWYDWGGSHGRGTWIHSTDPAELGRYLQRDQAELPELDANGSIPLLTRREHLDALLKWARDDDLTALKSFFSFEEVNRLADYLCADLFGRGSIRETNRPYTLTEVVGWRNMKLVVNPFYALAKTILWMTPAELTSIITACSFAFIFVLMAVLTIPVVFQLGCSPLRQPVDALVHLIEQCGVNSVKLTNAFIEWLQPQK
jgi:hypothetical protein